MKNYRFVFKGPNEQYCMFHMRAASPGDAVRQANATLFLPSGHIDTRLLDLGFPLAPGFEVTERMVVLESPVAAAPPKVAIDYLQGQGYTYHPDNDALFNAEDAFFEKAILDANGSAYGWFIVQAYQDDMNADYSLTIHAFVSPDVYRREIPGAGAAYDAGAFHDLEISATLDELPHVLGPYERKILDRVLAYLRENRTQL